MRDEALLKVIEAIPQQSQRQYSADEQLSYLRMVADKLGLYDASDRLASGRSTFMKGVDTIWTRRHRL